MDYLQYFLSILVECMILICFKPYYKWITFNTRILDVVLSLFFEVLNLIINGLPSILLL